jgi:hypothetical protein
MINLRQAAFAFAFAVSAAAFGSAEAMPVAPFVGAAEIARAAFVFDEALSPGQPVRLDRVDAEAAQAAAQTYFDFDAMITLGAFALAGGSLAAFAALAARRREEKTEEGEPAWRESVFRAVQADLAAFAETQRRAA